MNKWTFITIGGLFLIVLMLLAVIIFRKPETIVVPDKSADKRLIEENTKLKDRNNFLQHSIDSFIVVNEQLSRIEQTIKIIYRDKYKFIKGATTDELDSIIRFHTGLPSKP